MRKPPRFSGTTKAGWSMPFGGISRRPRSQQASGPGRCRCGCSRLICSPSSWTLSPVCPLPPVSEDPAVAPSTPRGTLLWLGRAVIHAWAHPVRFVLRLKVAHDPSVPGGQGFPGAVEPGPAGGRSVEWTGRPPTAIAWVLEHSTKYADTYASSAAARTGSPTW